MYFGYQDLFWFLCSSAPPPPRTKVPSTYFQIETSVHEVQVRRGQPRIANMIHFGGQHAAEDAKVSPKPEHFISTDALFPGPTRHCPSNTAGA